MSLGFQQIPQIGVREAEGGSAQVSMDLPE